MLNFTLPGGDRMKKEFKEAIEESPIIVAIKDDDGLDKCLECDSRIIFILYGDIITIPSIVEKVKSADKIAMVHVDLIHGLQSKEVAVDFIKKYTKADGVISTKMPIIQRAKELGLYTVMRFFIIDSIAYNTMEKQIKNAHPDVIEVLPAMMPSVLERIVAFAKCPVIAGGLVSEKSDVMSLFEVGVSSVSSTNQEVWFL